MQLTDFLQAPNSLTREINIFKTLKLISKRLGDLERLLTQTTLKVTKDKNVKIWNFIKSIFQQMDLKSGEYFDHTHLLAFLSNNDIAELEASILVSKKVDV
ncbi:hypothetical protein L873DRAFT_1824143 [Choiromyces venosus 120613-1]|uniref:Uncharacterized protein n=1 Tax=Choiromyces venosus 120613-1 TaxID=1336337 RepID=A0A3N4ISE2_9PEZI|nr:hypothetical protein L873DRAFT_1824143 [Choiromyces venosus 120613-1]